MLKMKHVTMEFANVINHAHANIVLLEAIVTLKIVFANVRTQSMHVREICVATNLMESAVVVMEETAVAQKIRHVTLEKEIATVTKIVPED